MQSKIIKNFKEQDWPDGDLERDEETAKKSSVTVTGRSLVTKTDVQSLEETQSHSEAIIENQPPQQTSVAPQRPHPPQEAEIMSDDLSVGLQCQECLLAGRSIEINVSKLERSTRETRSAIFAGIKAEVGMLINDTRALLFLSAQQSSEAPKQHIRWETR